jgi:hypothetical protein
MDDFPALQDAAPSPNDPAANYITANVLRGLLLGLDQIAGSQRATLLINAGLAQYAHTLPPADDSPTIQGYELVRLYQMIYHMLGGSLTRLFHHNSGVAYVEGVLQSAWGQHMLAEGLTIPPAEKLEWFVREFAAFAGRGWMPHAVSEDASAWYLTPAFCPICTGLAGVSAPLCAQTPALLSGLSKPLIGRQVRVREVECRAQGAAHCVFACYKVF